MKKHNLRWFARVSLLAAIAAVLMLWQFPLPLMPAFLTLDISDVPVVVGALLFGWPAGAAIAILKNLLHLPVSSTFGIGEIANATLALTYITVATLLRRWGWLAYVAATCAIASVAVFLNFTLLLPLYQSAFGISTAQLLTMSARAGSQLITVWDFMWWVIVPFNLIKGGLITLLALPIYRRPRTMPRQ